MMTQQVSPGQRSAGRTVQDAAAARFLLDPEARTVLGPFFGEGKSITRAAQQLHLKPNTLLRRVQRLLKLGLLEVARQELRAGRPVKHYRVTGETFFVPFRITDAVTLEDLLVRAVEEPNRLIARSMARRLSRQAAQVGYLVTRLPTGRIAHELSVDGQTPLDPASQPQPFWRDGQVLRLSRDRAQEFTHELMALCARYADDQGEPYLAFAAIAPLKP